MWIASTLGFYSIVQDQERKGRFLIRARERADLENLREAMDLPKRYLRVRATPESDYPFRMVGVQPAVLADAMKALQRSVTYPNFKDAVADTPDQAHKVRLYARVWSTLAELGCGLFRLLPYRPLPPDLPDLLTCSECGEELERCVCGLDADTIELERQETLRY